MPAVFPIAIFGSVGYYQALAKERSVIFEIHEHFPKQTLRNRYCILNAQGKLRLTVPVIKSNGSKTCTHDIVIDHSQNWQLIHWRGIKAAYSASPYFEHYASDIEKLLFSKEASLVHFTEHILHFFVATWQLPIATRLSLEFNNKPEIDYRFHDFDTQIANLKTYQQVMYHPEQNFISNLSILDLLFCEGPMGRNLLI